MGGEISTSTLFLLWNLSDGKKKIRIRRNFDGRENIIKNETP